MHIFQVGHVVETREGKPQIEKKKLAIFKNGIQLFNSKFVSEKSWPWQSLKGWNGFQNKFTLDFGSIEDAPYIFETLQVNKYSHLKLTLPLLAHDFCHCLLLTWTLTKKKPQ